MAFKVMRKVLGKSIENRDVVLASNFDPDDAKSLHAISESGRLTLLIGGTHGDERATVPLLDNFIRQYLDTGKISRPTAVISLLNPDGHARNTRHNAKGVDLNRNFPHNWRPKADEPPGKHPLSEPEAALLHAFILSARPAKIVSLHWALAELDADGPQSAAVAKAMWNALSPEEKKPYRLRVQETIQPDGFGPGAMPDSCPGSLGQWCGYALAYSMSFGPVSPAMVTLELPYHPWYQDRPDILPEDHLDHVRSLWETKPQAYLAGVESGVHRMMAAACEHRQAWA